MRPVTANWSDPRPSWSRSDLIRYADAASAGNRRPTRGGSLLRCLQIQWNAQKIAPEWCF
ncbi:hypothetical protein GCM10010326_04060 [Streptomyces xanthochromogenes]|uniref:Uncharacterized protein n=1 Tax=Streptomyces xanthochromogenes TaxID=67384 RepID=A0ABQ2ZJX2_9ACTN|nr:hypothetical protein GCM10010326_04060 [Streptomyces xanthochromogenes]